MESTNQHPGKNENNNRHPLNQENRKDYQHDDNKNEVDENGQKINWNDPEISEADNTQGRNPKNKTSDKMEPQNHKDVPNNENEVPQDGSITPLYGQDPSASTIQGSNADRTFGNDQENRAEQNIENPQGTTGEDLASRQAKDNNTSKDKNVEGDNES